MKFQKGQSGNPGGRPKVDPELVALARQYTETAIKTLAEIATDPKKPPAARVTAAIALLDRGHGKAPATLNANINDGREIASMLEFISGTPPAEMEAYVAAWQASGMAKPSDDTKKPH